MTACVQNEKLKAKSSPKDAAMIEVKSGATLSGVCVPPHHGIIQRSILAATSVVTPTASAPQNPLKRLISQAALPSGSNWKSQARIVQRGYPVGCGTPKCCAATMNSPESRRPTFGCAV